jgi:2-haloacid dehalogenase
VTIKAIVFDAYGTLYDIQSVATITDDAFPGYGELITQVWRIKQLEYTWLRSLMRRYADFSVVTRDSLRYALKIVGVQYDESIVETIMDKYLHLDLYADAKPTLLALKDYKRAILSNGSTEMLTALVRNTGLDAILDATISVDANRIFKPSPEAYSLIEPQLKVKPAEVLFVSSNPWDAIGAKSVGLKVAWIERVTPALLKQACLKPDRVPPRTMFTALRTQMDELGVEPDYRVAGLATLTNLLSS